MNSKKLPEGVNSYAELVRNYLALDYKLGVKEIVNRVRRDHGIEINSRTVDSSRVKYLKSIGKWKPVGKGYKQKFQRAVPVNAKTATELMGQVFSQTPFANGSLSKFKEGVEAIGGRQNALAILNLFSEE